MQWPLGVDPGVPVLSIQVGSGPPGSQAEVSPSMYYQHQPWIYKIHALSVRYGPSLLEILLGICQGLENQL